MVSKIKLIAIAAIGKNRALGKNNQLLWDLPTDLKHFRKTTKGFPVIMGARTFTSIGRPLPGRVNIVLSYDEDFPGTITVRNKDAALEAAWETGADTAYIIGGAQIYSLFLPETDELDLTLVDDAPEADVFFPPFEAEFQKISESAPITENGISFRFSRWVRKK